MSDIASLIRSMAAAGAPPEAIALAVEAVEAAQAIDAARRAKARDKKRAQRAAAVEVEAQDVLPSGGDMEGTVSGQSRDKEGTVPAEPFLSLPPPQTPPPSLTYPTKNNARTRKGTRLPKDFPMPEDWLAWAMAERRWSRADAQAEADIFRDYWPSKPGKDGLKLDWQATWRVWVRSSKRGSSPGGAGGRGPSGPIRPVSPERREQARREAAEVYRRLGRSEAELPDQYRDSEPKPIGQLIPMFAGGRG